MATWVHTCLYTGFTLLCTHNTAFSQSKPISPALVMYMKQRVLEKSDLYTNKINALNKRPVRILAIQQCFERNEIREILDSLSREKAHKGKSEIQLAGEIYDALIPTLDIKKILPYNTAFTDSLTPQLTPTLISICSNIGDHVPDKPTLSRWKEYTDSLIGAAMKAISLSSIVEKMYVSREEKNEFIYQVRKYAHDWLFAECTPIRNAYFKTLRKKILYDWDYAYNTEGFYTMQAFKKAIIENDVRALDSLFPARNKFEPIFLRIQHLEKNAEAHMAPDTTYNGSDLHPQQKWLYVKNEDPNVLGCFHIQMKRLPGKMIIDSISQNSGCPTKYVPETYNGIKQSVTPRN